jgi:hypothetical protein
MNPLPISTEELLSFDHYICYCSGGACSTAALLNTLELGMPDQWATTRQLFPEKFARIAQMERDMHHTIDPKLTVEQKANLGTPYPEASDRTLIAELKDEHWDKHYSIFTSDWKLPAGAFRKCGGPL